MDYDFDDCLGELVSSEQLSEFSVVDSFCNTCGKVTPHHIDETQVNRDSNEDDVIHVRPLSLQDCVVCARDEESKLEF